MSIKYYLAIDIGASSGRHMIGYLQNGQLKLEECYRFDNAPIEVDGQLCWDTDYLFEQVLVGIKKAVLLGKTPSTIGIDTWGVDFVLLDANGKKLGQCVCYRDKRTFGMMEKFWANEMSKEEIYSRTGIAFLEFNSIYQLYALKQKDSKLLVQAEIFLMMGDYLNFLLTGIAKSEYTNASTSQLVNQSTKTWDSEILSKLGVKHSIFLPLNQPSCKVGFLKPDLVSKIGADNIEVVMVASHDTASAYLAAPSNPTSLYLSSGTWSLIGVELAVPHISNLAMSLNYTNEGGVPNNYRFLKNIMGLWVIGEVRKEYDQQYSFVDLVKLASQADESFSTILPLNDRRFLNPPSMINEIKTCSKELGLEVPKNIEELAKCVFLSLASCYNDAMHELEDLLNFSFSNIVVFGGGCQNNYLNSLLSKISGKEVLVGPVEATAIGNILLQLMTDSLIKNSSEAKELVRKSFDLSTITTSKITN